MFDAIPSGIITLLRGINSPCPLTHTVNVSDTAVGGLCFSAEHQIIIEQLGLYSNIKYFRINLLFLFAKDQIHKCKFSGSCSRFLRMNLMNM